MTHDARPLSPRHARFVAEFLQDGNATRAYIRAGYSPRGAQPSASRLLRDPRIEAAIAAGRQRLVEALAVSAERLTQEYAKIAFASVDDFVSVEDDGRLRIDLEKASQAQRAGIVELRISNHRKQEQTVILKLGKLQALAALTKQLGGLAAKPKPADPCDGLAKELEAARRRAWGDDWPKVLDGEPAETPIAAAAQAPVDADGPAAPPREDEPAAPPPEEEGQGLTDVLRQGLGPPDAGQMPGMPTSPPPAFDPGPLRGTMRWVKNPRREPDHDPYTMICNYDPYAYLSREAS